MYIKATISRVTLEGGQCVCCRFIPGIFEADM